MHWCKILNQAKRAFFRKRLCKIRWFSPIENMVLCGLRQITWKKSQVSSWTLGKVGLWGGWNHHQPAPCGASPAGSLTRRDAPFFSHHPSKLWMASWPLSCGLLPIWKEALCCRRVPNFGQKPSPRRRLRKSDQGFGEQEARYGGALGFTGLNQAVGLELGRPQSLLLGLVFLATGSPWNVIVGQTREWVVKMAMSENYNMNIVGMKLSLLFKWLCRTRI